MENSRKRVRGDERVGGYSNDENPFGDSNLSERFVWKQLPKSRQTALDEEGNVKEETADEFKARLTRAEHELQQARRRREERAVLRKKLDEEARRVAVERERAEHDDWERAEDLFNAKQHYSKQAILIRQRRPRLVDILARNTRLDMLDIPEDTVPVFQHLRNQSQEQYLTLLGQMQDECAYAEAMLLEEGLTDKDREFIDKTIEWWEALMDLTDAELHQAHQHWNQDIDRELNDMLREKEQSSLEELRSTIQLQLNQGEMVDVEYWEVLLAKIRILICKEKLRLLQVDFFVEREERKMARNQEGVPSSIPAVRFPQPSEEGHIDDDERAGRINKIDERDDDDEAFMEEFVLETANKYSWNDKYRPRKPRYFNRVHTAYEWNKYNQTHYDHDNPPPKTVQGYKFSIFYPDLIDKTIPPSFRVQETENPDVAILRFVAGPPYEDIAFKIVNREWEHSHRKGYRSSFERGILHLWFNFKRLRYRR